MNLIFMGSPAFAVPSLKALVEAGHTIVAVYTQPPRPAGRGQKLTPTAVHQEAERLGLGDKVKHPERLRGEALDDIMAIPCEAVCVVAYGLLLPKRLVDDKLCLNVHPSALPRWRGAAPIQHTLLAGDTTTDVCIMKLDEGMDTGPVYHRTPLAISPDTTAGSLHDTCANIGARALVHVLANLDTLQPIPQTGEATLAPKITPNMRPIDWHQPSTVIHNHIRALSPSPAATAVLGGEVVKVLSSCVIVSAMKPSCPPGTILKADTELHIACGDGVLRILSLQRPNKKPMLAEDALRGWSIK